MQIFEEQLKINAKPRVETRLNIDELKSARKQEVNNIQMILFVLEWNFFNKKNFSFYLLIIIYLIKIFSEQLNWHSISKVGPISFENIKYKPNPSNFEVFRIRKFIHFEYKYNISYIERFIMRN